MVDGLFTLIGGIGLFLLGMTLLSDGSKAFAGDNLRGALLRFTGRPVNAFASGALVTALVQSSSATTVTMIGFVSAGLLTFPQAIGVILGANLGTTSTGWIVSVLGLKVSIGYYALPMVGAGAFMRLLARGRWKSFGLALAGFGLIFVGIETLQAAMSGLPVSSSLSGLPSGGLAGRALVAVIGAGMTVVLQSSSAAVATTLTALHTGSVNFEQAALLVIGASIGTTVTGVLAAIGASVPAKRTALALVLFNSATGIIAMVLLPALLRGIRWAQEHSGLEAGATSLAAFHTLFVSLGAFLFLPMVDRFARWVERLLPDRGPALTAHLDDTLLHVPAVALEATRRSLKETAVHLFGALQDSLDEAQGKASNEPLRLQIQQALGQTQEFFARIPPMTEDCGVSELRLSLLHGLDHLVRLQGYVRPPANVRRLFTHIRLAPAVAKCREVLERSALGLHGSAEHDWLAEVERTTQDLARLNRQERPALLRQTASGEWQAMDVLDALDALRWLNTVTHHTWRVSRHLMGEGAPKLVADQESWPA
jgi:phosphate:Na+ symporter